MRAKAQDVSEYQVIYIRTTFGFKETKKNHRSQFLQFKNVKIS